MKGQVSLIEAIMSAIALFIAFSMIITTGEYQTKWKESTSSLQGRDILITADRLGRLYDYSFSPDFKTEFLNKIDSIKDAVVKYETQGAVESPVYIACDCTPAQETYIQNILNDVKFNTRGITAVVCSTTLLEIKNCGASTTYPNALVIWRYDALEEPTRGNLIDFINDGNGLIEIADVQNSRVDGSGNDDHEGQKIIFGLKSIPEGNFPSNQDEFLKPRNSSQLPYQSYKWFHHLPYLLNAPTSIPSVPVDTLPPPVCLTVREGKFKFQNAERKFWICDGSSVYFDTDGTDKADLGPITKRQEFSIGASNFKLNYIDATNKIRISFKPDYKFNDFVGDNNANNKLAPIDDNKNKVLLSMGFWDAAREKPIAAIIFNGAENVKTAWMADFARGPSGLTDSGDDHKQLLASMIFSISNKKTKETFQQVGQITSYINANNTDVLEIYRIDLIIGKPF